jgi:hypothetical protein
MDDDDDDDDDDDYDLLHVEDSNKHIIEEIVRQDGYLPELYHYYWFHREDKHWNVPLCSLGRNVPRCYFHFEGIYLTLNSETTWHTEKLVST